MDTSINLEARIRVLEEHIRSLEYRILTLESRNNRYGGPISPTAFPRVKCQKCGLDLSGVNSYACPNPACNGGFSL